MSDKDDSLKRNFLKISIFNLEQKIKANALRRANEIDSLNIDIGVIKKHLDEFEIPNKENIVLNIQKFEASLKVIRDYEVDLFSYIDYYYKFGNVRVADFCLTKDEVEKPTKKPRKPRKKKDQS